jgi:hypothetical protein
LAFTNSEGFVCSVKCNRGGVNLAHVGVRDDPNISINFGGLEVELLKVRSCWDFYLLID